MSPFKFICDYFNASSLFQFLARFTIWNAPFKELLFINYFLKRWIGKLNKGYYCKIKIQFNPQYFLAEIYPSFLHVRILYQPLHNFYRISFKGSPSIRSIFVNRYL